MANLGLCLPEERLLSEIQQVVRTVKCRMGTKSKSSTEDVRLKNYSWGPGGPNPKFSPRMPIRQKIMWPWVFISQDMKDVRSPKTIHVLLAWK